MSLPYAPDLPDTVGGRVAFMHSGDTRAGLARAIDRAIAEAVGAATRPAAPDLDTLPHDPEVWDHPAETSDGVTDTSLSVRYPSGDVIPVGVQGGWTARAVARGILRTDGYTVTGATRVTSSGVRLLRTL